MSFEQEKMYAPMNTFNADKGQPHLRTNEQSKENNHTECDYDEFQRRKQRMSHPGYLHTVSMSELYENVYQCRPPIIDGLLYPGTYLFVGAPKLGKSFFMAQLGYHVSTGTPLWGYHVRKGTVLYLALEDDYRRLQGRLFRMYGTHSAENLYFAVCAKNLSNGLDEQLREFIWEHPDTKLIIVDTLQKVREVSGEKYTYASDYEIIGKLKQFADHNGISLLLVHHTRKQQAEDRFDMISGTNGLLGAADGAFLLQKEQRTSNDATLDISGRDQADQRFYLKRDPEKLMWLLERTETELWKEPPSPLLESVAGIISKENPLWSGTPTELANLLGMDMKPNVLTLQLNVNAGRLINEHGIRYENSRSHAGRKVSLELTNPEA